MAKIIVSVLLLALSTAATAAAQRDVLVLDLVASSMTDEQEVVDLATEYIALEIGKRPQLQVVTNRDLRQMLDVEAQKQALDCDDSSCLLEIGDALGAELVVYGTMAKLGGIYAISLSVFSTKERHTVERIRVETPSVEGLSGAIASALRPALDRVAPREFGALGWTGVGTAVIGGVTAIAFAALAGMKELELGQPATVARHEQTRAEGLLWLGGAVISTLIASGGALLIAGEL